MPQILLKAFSTLVSPSTVVTNRLAPPTAPKLPKFTFFTRSRMYWPAWGLPAATFSTTTRASSSLTPKAPTSPIASARIGISASIAK